MARSLTRAVGPILASLATGLWRKGWVYGALNAPAIAGLLAVGATGAIGQDDLLTMVTGPDPWHLRGALPTGEFSAVASWAPSL